MKKILTILTIAILVSFLASCGTFKRSSNTSSNTTTKSSDSAAASKIKTDSSVSETSVIKEKVDTTINIEGSKQNGSKPADNILKGDSLVLDNEDQHITVKFDPATGNIKASGQVKNRKARVLIDRELTNSKSTSVKNDQEASTHVSNNDINAVQNKQVETKVKSGLGVGAWITISLLAGFLILFLYAFIKVRFGRLF